MDILIYFFNVLCTNCGYISFRQDKNCGSCGHILNKVATLSASLFRNDSFTIFLNSKAAEKEQDDTCLSSSQIHEEISVIEPSQNSQEHSKHNPEDFVLNLSDAEQDQSEATLESDSPKLEITNYSPSEFRSDVHTNPKEVNQEMQEHKPDDFVLNLSDAEQDQSEATLEPDSPKLEITNYSPSEFSSDVDNNLQEEGLELLNPVEEVPVVPVTNKTKREETQFEKLEIKNSLYKYISNEDFELDNGGKNFKITLPPSQNMEQHITEPIAPTLDLGNSEILGFEPENLTEDPAPPSSQLDKIKKRDNLDNTFLIEDIAQDISEPKAPVLDLGNAEILLDLEPESTVGDSSVPPT